jgi:hypothetical protein
MLFFQPSPPPPPPPELHVDPPPPPPPIATTLTEVMPGGQSHEYTPGVSYRSSTVVVSGVVLKKVVSP